MRAYEYWIDHGQLSHLRQLGMNAQVEKKKKMSAFLERLSISNMLNCAEQVQIQKYKIHANKALKTAGVQSAETSN